VILITPALVKRLHEPDADFKLEHSNTPHVVDAFSPPRPWHQEKFCRFMHQLREQTSS